MRRVVGSAPMSNPQMRSKEEIVPNVDHYMCRCRFVAREIPGGGKVVLSSPEVARVFSLQFVETTLPRTKKNLP